MKNVVKKISILVMGLLLTTACTLSTTGLRPPSDHSLVYPKPEPKPEPVVMAAPVCQPPSAMGAAGDLSGCKVGDKVVLRGLNFAVNSAELSVEGKNLLDLVAVAMKAAPAISVEIGGHTDSTGDDAYNLTLSQKRVASVQNYLSIKGIPISRMTMKGYGESMPVAGNSDAAGRAQNRRVELMVISQMAAQTVAPRSVVMTERVPSPAVAAEMPPRETAVVMTEQVPAPPGGTQVSIIDNAFVPETLTVDVGATVTWTNTGGSNHIVKFPDASSSRLRTGAQYSRTMDTAGTYTYECAIHGSRMSGKIVVK